MLEVCKDLERNGYDVTFLDVDRARAISTSAQFVRALRPDTLLVTIMHANNETGVIFPIEQLSRLTKETDPAIVFHTDATQSVGKLPIDLAGDTATSICSPSPATSCTPPRASACCTSSRGTPCRPLLIGGHQEEGRRAGTENVPYIVGLAKAVELAAAASRRRSRRASAACATGWKRRIEAHDPPRAGQRPAAPRGCPTR